MPSPLREQYLEIKRRHPGLLLLFQIGDFYEAFDEDAQVLARELGVTLTRKWFGKGDVRPLAGVPVRSLEGHLQRLIERGHKIAICDQDRGAPAPRDPLGHPGKGLVARQVVRVITPGTVMEPGLLSGRESNYLGALVPGSGVGRSARAGLAYADVSTGEFRLTEMPLDEALGELQRLRPAELLLPRGVTLDDHQQQGPDETSAPGPTSAADAVPRYGAAPEPLGRLGGVTVTYLDPALLQPEAARQALLLHFQAASLLAYGCEDLPLGTRAAAAIVTYLRDSQPEALLGLTQLGSYAADGFMHIDPQALRSLEVFPAPALGFGTGRGASAAGSLVQVLDQTRTPLGGRLLRRWLRHPLLDLLGIRGRQDAIEWFQGRPDLRRALLRELEQVQDLERLHQRVRRRLATPAEVLVLTQGLRHVGAVRQLLTAERAPAAFVDGLDPCADLCELTERALQTAPLGQAAGAAGAAVKAGAGARQAEAGETGGGIIRPGFSTELDELRRTLSGGRRFLAELEGRERQRTGIKSLKVGYHQIFGYYIEVTRPNLRLVPADYIRKQTLTGSERFYTLELKEYETLIANARERVELLDAHLFRLVCEQLGRHHARVWQVAAALALLDVYAALGEVAAERGYVRAEVHEGDELRISQGRHPVLERAVRSFVPNDTLLGGPGPQVMLLTAPNMAGKSVYLRQVALICLMGQIGCPVPAAAARLPVLDRIFTRIGVRDEIQAGQSSFLAELVETAHILHHATPRSLIVLDELGRGTATTDGLALAQAVLEYLHNHPRLRSKLLFATHFHELCACADTLPRAANFHLLVRERDAEVDYLHQVVPGRAERSFGLHVGRLAGLPRPVLRRAAELLAHSATQPAPAGAAASSAQAGLVAQLRSIDINDLSPVEALTRLYELQQAAAAAQQTEPPVGKDR